MTDSFDCQPDFLLLINPELDATRAEASFKPLADWALSVNGSYTFNTAPSWLTFFNAEITGNVRLRSLEQKDHLQANY